MSARRHLWVHRCVVFACAGAVSACGEFARANLMDPKSQLAIEITGPDSTYSVGETVQFTATTAPEWPLGATEWESSHPTMIAPVGGGKFKVLGLGCSLGCSNIRATITARFGPHALSRNIVLTQRVARLTIQKCEGNAPCDLMTAVGEGRRFTVLRWDELGTALDPDYIPTPPLTFSIRDPSILAVEKVTQVLWLVTARAYGSTWLVARAGNVADSMLFSVKRLTPERAF